MFYFSIDRAVILVDTDIFMYNNMAKPSERDYDKNS